MPLLLEKALVGCSELSILLFRATAVTGLAWPCCCFGNGLSLGQWLSGSLTEIETSCPLLAVALFHGNQRFSGTFQNCPQRGPFSDRHPNCDYCKSFVRHCEEMKASKPLKMDRTFCCSYHLYARKETCSNSVYYVD